MDDEQAAPSTAYHIINQIATTPYDQPIRASRQTDVTIDDDIICSDNNVIHPLDDI